MARTKTIVGKKCYWNPRSKIWVRPKRGGGFIKCGSGGTRKRRKTRRRKRR